MKFLTGDDIGIIKRVLVEGKKVERFGVQRKGDAVQRLCWAGPAEDREARVGAGYESGALELRSGANGEVLCTAAAAGNVVCLEAIDRNLLAVSSNGSGGIVREWCGDASPSEPGQVVDITGKVVEEDEGASGGTSFTLPGPVNCAQADPCSPSRLVFGGDENDVKIFDLSRSEVTWKAKSLPENTLCLAVPKRVATLSWGTKQTPSRDLIYCGTKDGKIRAYDAKQQRRPLFELVIGFEVGVGTASYTGTTDDVPRPCLCTCVSQVRGDGWSLFVGNNMGILREYDLRQMPTCPAAPDRAGKKVHKRWANKQMPFRRGYRGIMGAVRAIDVHCSGEAMVAASVGRFAYIFDLRKRKDLGIEKVYLKQKLCSVLLSGEARQAEKEESDHEEDEKKDGGSDDDGADKIQEGFSDDEGCDAEPAPPKGDIAGDDYKVEDDEDEGMAAEEVSAPKSKAGRQKKQPAGRKRPKRSRPKASAETGRAVSKAARLDEEGE